MAPSVSLAIASRAENLLMADIAIRLSNPSSRTVLFCELPCNASRRSRAIRSLIGSMTWNEVHASPTIKYSSLPAWLRRPVGRLLERSIHALAIACSLVRVVAYGLSQRRMSVDLVCGRPRPVTARQDDAPAADQAAITNVVELTLFSGGGGLIQTTSG